MIPIQIQKIKTYHSRPVLDDETVTVKNYEKIEYLMYIVDGSTKWTQSYICSREELIAFRNHIDELLAKITTAELLNLPEKLAAEVDEHLKTDELCQGCKFRLSNSCPTCLFTLESPLERMLFMALKSDYINFIPQYPIDWNGNTISENEFVNYKQKGDFRKVLTVADFFISKKSIKLCVYTDGHTYHERTEEQAARDRNIDRKLQELGFVVLRYTGKEVRDNLPKIISDIKKWIS